MSSCQKRTFRLISNGEWELPKPRHLTIYVPGGEKSMHAKARTSYSSPRLLPENISVLVIEVRVYKMKELKWEGLKEARFSLKILKPT
jgi:hypothetical protein